MIFRDHTYEDSEIPRVEYRKLTKYFCQYEKYQSEDKWLVPERGNYRWSRCRVAAVCIWYSNASKLCDLFNYKSYSGDLI